MSAPGSPRWVELTRTVGEINARLVAGDLENEDIRTHIELEGSAWFYVAEDPNQLATIYVLEPDLERAKDVLKEAEEGGSGVSDDDLVPDYDDDVAAMSPSYPILGDQDTGLRSRPLRWAIAAVIVGALVFGFLRGTVFDIFS